MSGSPARGRAGGKVILLGEHAVVYGRPAVATGLPLGIEAEALRDAGPRLESDVVPGDARGEALVAQAAEALALDPRRWVVRVCSDLPPGQGLGSSAALCVAVLRALAAAAGRRLERDEELDLGRRLEGIFHGTPSGIDPAAAALGTTFRFVRGDPPLVERLVPGAPMVIVVAPGDVPRSTGAAVGGLRERRQAERARYEALFDAVAEVVEEGIRALCRGDATALGAAFDRNQTLLERMGVSSPEIERRVAAARVAGALGAKLTGGGVGGAVIALVDDEHEAAVTNAVRQQAAAAFRIRIAGVP
ncbi:MAG TPA: mevalonate kinase [Candidatus Limnocylindria bacterium]|nr:mevalonate kinase [Candidatus Limnocylindria bacterium]